MVDTLGVSRAVLSLKSNSLASVAEHLALGVKGKEIHQAIGMRLAALKANPDLYRAYVNYALNDATLCEGTFDKLVRTGRFPYEELYIQDLVLRCAVVPTLHANVPMLQRHLEDLRKCKQSLLNDCGCDRATLMSNAQFCEALESLGVTVKTKISVTGSIIPAIAKTEALWPSWLNTRKQTTTPISGFKAWLTLDWPIKVRSKKLARKSSWQ